MKKGILLVIVIILNYCSLHNISALCSNVLKTENEKQKVIEEVQFVG